MVQVRFFEAKVVCVAGIVCAAIGRAQGEFAVPVDLAPDAGYEASSKWTDVDGDLQPDLLRSDLSLDLLRVQLRVGGGLGPPTDFNFGAEAGAFATADVDRDGDIDVVASTNWPFGVSVLLGDGTGAFAAPIQIPTLNDYLSSALDAADLDGDGLADIVVTYGTKFTSTGYAVANKLAVLRSAGPGAWSAPLFYDIGSGARSLAIADLDRDGDRDFVVATKSGLSIGWNDGLAGFNLGALGVFASFPSVCVADLDLDAIPDLIASTGHGNLRTWRGLGGTAFAAPVVYTTSMFSWNMVVADVNGDGWKDVLLSNNDANYRVEIRHGLPGGTLGPASFFASSSRYALDVFDFDGDGRLDVLTEGHYLCRNAGAFAPVYSYCPAKLTAVGCTPEVTYSGLSSLSQSSGFVISAIQVPSQVSGLFFYGLSGASAAPFSGGSMCVAGPRVRTPVQNSGGPLPAGADCSGTLSIDFNAYGASGVGPAAVQVAGTIVHGQFWMRDVGAPPPATTATSDALRFERIP